MDYLLSKKRQKPELIIKLATAQNLYFAVTFY